MDCGFTSQFRAALVIILAVSVALPLPSLAAPNCPLKFATLIDAEAKQLQSLKLAEHWNKYHELAASSLPEKQELRGSVEAMASAYSELEPAFPKKDFLLFLDSDSVVSNGAPPYPKTLGELMERSYARFVAQYQFEGLALTERAKGITGYSRELVEKCGRSPRCYKQELRKIPAWSTELVKGTCLATSVASRQELARDIGVAWAVMGTYFATQTDRNVRDFPFAFIANGLFWSSVFAEKNCRRAMTSAQTLPFGKSLVDSKLPTWWAQSIKGAKEELAEWKWFPITASTAVGLGYLVDRAEDREKSAEYYGWRWSFMVLYNTVSGPVRRVLVLDPLFKKAFPQLGNWISEQVKSGKMAELVTRVGAAGMDYGLRYKEWTVWSVFFAEYIRRTMGPDAP